MTNTTQITLDLELTDDFLSGRARGGAGSGRAFSGWLGLMAAIDELLAAAGTKEETVDDTATVSTEALRGLMAGRVLEPGDQGWDEARGTFNLVVDQNPALIVFPASVDDVVAAVRHAREAGLRIAPQRTGHNASPLGPLADTILLRTDALDEVEIDAAARRARVGAGVRWADVVDRASELGLAALHGTTPDVSVTGYTLGGGVGWYARRHGLAANSVLAIEIVTPDGVHRRVDPGTEPDLFWALRGGGGSFGVVTALEFELFPVSEVYAGALFFPLGRASEVLHAWHEWTADAPDEVTSVVRVLQFPPAPQVPEPMRGKSFAVIEAVILAGESEAGGMLAPLRALGPAMDTFAAVAPAGIAELHGDPRDPIPSTSGHMVLGEVSPAAIDRLVELTGEGSGSPLVSVELRHLGGALGRDDESHGALGRMSGSYLMFAVGAVFDEAAGEAARARIELVRETLSEHSEGEYLNFADAPTDPAGFFSEDALRRLAQIRAAYDPDRLVRANHEIPPAG